MLETSSADTYRYEKRKVTSFLTRKHVQKGKLRKNSGSNANINVFTGLQKT